MVLPSEWQRAQLVFDEWFGLVDEILRTKLQDLEQNEPELAALVAQLFEQITTGDQLFEQDTSASDQLLRKVAQIPERIGNYRVLGLLGEGGLGSVYQAFEAKDGIEREVAVKVLHTGKGKHKPERMRGELTALKEMHHPHIAALYNWSLEGETPHLVMEFVRGWAFDIHNDHHKLTLKSRLKLFRQLCDAVEHSHGKGVIHGDLKPSNILVSRSGETDNVKVIDFGIARLQKDEPKTAADPDASPLMGTTTFMSPESLEPGAVPDQRQDVYALGILLCQALCGKYPYVADLKAVSLREIRQTKLGLKVSPLKLFRELGDGDRIEIAKRRKIGTRELEKCLTGDLDGIVRKATDPDPSRRYRNVGQLLEDLIRYEEHFPVEALRPHSLLYRLNKFYHRYSVLCMFLITFLGMSVISAFLFTKSYFEIKSEKAKVQKAYDELERTHQLYLSMLNMPHPYFKGNEVKLIDVIKITEEQLSQFSKGDTRLEARIRFNLAEIHFSLRELDHSLVQAKKAHQLILNHPDMGPDSKNAAEVHELIARNYCYQGKWEESEKIYNDILIKLKPFGPKFRSTVIAQSGLGRLLLDRQRFKEAEALIRTARAHLDEQWDPQYRVAHTLDTNLALALKGMRRIDEARTLMSSVLKSQEKFLDKHHPFVVDTRYNLAMLLLESGEYAQAAEMLRNVYQQQSGTPGYAEHSSLLTLYGLALAEYRLGRVSEAEVVLGKLWENRSKLQIPQLFVAVGTMLAPLLQEKHPNQALEIWEEIGSMPRAQPLENSEAQLKYLNNLGETLLKVQQLAEARFVLDQVYAKKRELYGASHRSTLDTLLTLGEWWLEKKDPQSARGVFTEAVKLSQANDDEDYLKFCQGFLGESLYELGLFEAAHPLLEEGLTSSLSSASRQRRLDYCLRATERALGCPAR